MVGPVNSSWVSASSAVAGMARSATGSGAPAGEQPCWTTYPFLPILLPILNPALRAIPARVSWSSIFDHMAPWTSFFEHLFLTSFSDSFFLRFGRNLAPTWPPTWTQNPPKIAPRAIQNPSKISSCFSCPLGLIFGRFLVQLGLQNQSKMHPKLSPKAPQPAHNGNSKTYKKPIGFL